MSTTLSLLLLINFAIAGLLPILFFRRDGTFNFAWFLTALPFFTAFVMIILAWMGLVDPALQAGSVLFFALQAVAVIFSAVSICLLGMTVGTHRIPLALWHQDNDDIVELVTWGPYARIRHPIYSCFLLSFIAVILAFPHWMTASIFLYAIIALTLTAIREERRLKESSFGTEYADYMIKTGRFIPSFRGVTGD